MKIWLFLKAQNATVNPSRTSKVTVTCDSKDLELPWEEFADRYVRPAFTQLVAEMKQRNESVGPGNG